MLHRHDVTFNCLTFSRCAIFDAPQMEVFVKRDFQPVQEKENCTPEYYDLLSNENFERLGGPLDEIVTVSVHKFNVVMSRPNLVS